VAQGYTGIHAADWLAWISEGKPLPEKPVLLTFDDGYADLVHEALPALEARGFKATMFIVSQHIGDASSWDLALGYPQRPLMTAPEILKAAERGIEIGAHTRTHRDLRTLSLPDLKDELEGCQKDLSELIGVDVNIFAYPFGFNNETVRQCAGAFYDLSFGCKPGLNHWRSDRRQLRRMFIYPNRLNFALQVKYGVDLYVLWCITRDHVHCWIRRFGPEIERKHGQQTAVDDLGAAK
jgi:peptidoglycan/xylan/chitin deacetylase (PgdA/CDA1 family)